jgi:hypothetical protein
MGAWKENLKLIDHWKSSGRVAETSRRMQTEKQKLLDTVKGLDGNPCRPDE